MNIVIVGGTGDLGFGLDTVGPKLAIRLSSAPGRRSGRRKRPAGSMR